jgi:hypothetical protein
MAARDQSAREFAKPEASAPAAGMEICPEIFPFQR